jgi:hypothetical protein
MVDLPDQPADNDTVNPWNVREAILNTGSSSAAELGRWAKALDLNDEVTASQRRRGADVLALVVDHQSPLPDSTRL